MKILNLILSLILAIALIFHGLTLDKLENKIEQLSQELAGANFKIADLEGRNFDFTKIYANAQKAVVSVAGGTGFLFEKKTQIITAFHVIKLLPDKKVEILPNDGVHILIRGEIRFIKEEWDLAVIELEEPIDAEPLMPADIISLAKGERVLVIGNPDGVKNSLSTGIISGLDIKRSLLSLSLIQTDARLDRGNSGGPVINKDGKVIGMVSNSMINLTFGFVVPIDKVNQLIREGGAP